MATNTTTTKRQPGDDRPVAAGAELTVLQALREYKREAGAARRTRLLKNRQNFRAYLGEQDWSHKQKGQSREFLPKVPMAVEQFAAFVKRALVAFGDWFQVDVPPQGELTGDEIRRLMLCKLDHLSRVEPGRADFPTLMSDAVKVGALGSLVVLKVHGRHVTRRGWQVERGLKGIEVNGALAPQVTERLVAADQRTWQLLVDLVRPEDYFPDPTGRALYEIHQIERDLHEVEAWADAGLYDPKAVEQIRDDMHKLEEESDRARLAGQDPSSAPAFRKRVVIDECWGTLLGADGRATERNIVCAMANDRYLIRPPEKNPLWHGESPFIAAPLIRVPWSVWHKALMDHAASLNVAMNELYNLMLDGGMAAVWGTRQLRADWLEDPRQVSDGIPYGSTLTIKAEVPAGAKVLETVTTGQVPLDAMQMMALSDREFQAAALINDLKMGLLPPRTVKATEIVEAQQGQAVTIDGIVRDVEKSLIEPVLRKGWLTLMQFAEDLAAEDVVAVLGPRPALALARMSPAQRFARWAGVCEFRVHGLSAVLARVREFQKLAALLQLVMGNPLLLQTFLARFSPDKTLSHIMKTLNIDPATIEQDQAEREGMPQRLKQLPFFSQLAGVKRGGGAGLAAEDVGETSLPAEINQMTENPVGGGV